jgi:GT2 family glycosyltransferase
MWLSVVVPTHDTRELTLRCLAALAAWPRSGIEVLLVDDGSSDGTAEAVALAHPEVAVLRRERAGGFSVAANLGLAAARGEVLLLLNSDTEVDPDGHAALRSAFRSRPRLGAGGAALRFPDGSAQWSGGPFPDVAWLFAQASGLGAAAGALPGFRRVRPLDAARRGDVDWVSGAALALRRSALDEVGPLDEGYAFYAQDLDCCLRLRRAGWEVALLPEFRVLHVAGATIGRQGGTAQRFHPSLLWADLLRFASKRGGPAEARQAARALFWGARLRLLGRTLWPGDEARRRDTAAFRAGLQAIARFRAGLPA